MVYRNKLSWRPNPEEIRVYNIPETNIARLNNQILLLNEKAVKLGNPPVSLTIIGETTKTHKHPAGDWDEKIYHITVQGEAPRLAGWTFIATITPQPSGENLVKCVPGFECPVIYREADPYDCDHCHTRRQRRDVFILKHDSGEYAQVGRTCLRDFLGHKDPTQIVSMAELLISLDDLIRDAEGEGWGGGYTAPEFNLKQFVAASACCIRRLGWVPRSRSDGENSPTSSCVVDLLVPPFGAQAAQFRKQWIEQNKLYVTEADEELADKAIEWGAQLPTEGNDYIYNLGVAVRNGVVLAGSKNSTVGIVASLVSAYQREAAAEKELIAEQQRTTSSTHIGDIGEKVELHGLIVRAIREFPSYYGLKTLIRFEDPQNNILVWWKSGESNEWAKDSYENSTPVDVTATVKAHEDYKGTAQTILLRVKEGIKQKKAEKKAGATKRDGSRKCGNCGETGHNKRTCPNKSRRLRKRRTR